MFANDEANGPVTWRLPTGDVFQGTMVDGQCCGFGVLRYDDTSVYEGEWKDDMFHGHGVLTKDTWSYEGFFKEDNADGLGVRKDTDGVRAGIFSNGTFKGPPASIRYLGPEPTKSRCRTIVIYPDGHAYEGWVKGGVAHGEGVILFPSSQAANAVCSITGKFKAGKCVGKAEVKFCNGRVYNGETAEGKATGKGEIRFPDGAVYKGTVNDGARQGRGKLKFSDGSKYKGDWDNDRPHGCGKRTFTTKNTYDGEWRSGDWYGKGTYTTCNMVARGIWTAMLTGEATVTYTSEHKSYVGGVKEGKPHGWVKFQWRDSSARLTQEYEGQFKDGQIHGVGAMWCDVHERGPVKAGNWDNGKFLGNLGKSFYRGASRDGDAHGSGFVIYPDGRVYKGMFSHAKRDGYGDYYFPSGGFYHGSFSSSKYHGRGTKYWSQSSGSCKKEYTGDWDNGRMHGGGSCTYWDGDRYTGCWRDDDWRGKGTYWHGKGTIEAEWTAFGKGRGTISLGWISSGAQKYEGEIERSVANGWGVWSFASCESDLKSGRLTQEYEGQFKDGKYHGVGALRCNIQSNGQVKAGRWSNDNFLGTVSEPCYHGGSRNYQAHGLCMIVYPAGIVYKGECAHGSRQGKGVLRDPDGSYKQGDFYDGLPHGHIVSVDHGSNGEQRYEGEFQRGKYHGEGKVVLHDGAYYDGHWRNGMPDGYGTAYNYGKGYQSGYWVRGQMDGHRFGANLAEESR
ncbi:MORN repeat [Carpediemonas membranifera]|uniref:MORN repeat n=1 Tax=Carpediemonas membranifera TaxID=201153 RepID=A0A8J6ARH0_9EUKA|nr:MORN repeat [Carpediemonas membranifera]|eukprot:KAG9390350.1 MORN repeat [Carpediemonas membranifera]